MGIINYNSTVLLHPGSSRRRMAERAPSASGIPGQERRSTKIRPTARAKHLRKNEIEIIFTPDSVMVGRSVDMPPGMASNLRNFRVRPAVRISRAPEMYNRVLITI